MTDCRLCPAGTVALHLASALAAGAAGNRTRQRRETPLSGFEDRRQRGRPCSSFAKRGLRAPVMAGVLRVDPEEIRPRGRRAKTRTDHLRLAAQYPGRRARRRRGWGSRTSSRRRGRRGTAHRRGRSGQPTRNTGLDSPLVSPGSGGVLRQAASQAAARERRFFEVSRRGHLARPADQATGPEEK